MLDLVKQQKTNNLFLRLIGNVSGSIFAFLIIRVIRNEDKGHNLRAKMFAKICPPFSNAQDKWATYYIDKPV